MPDEVELNPFTNEEINTMNSVVQIESSLDIKNKTENRKKYTRKDLVTMDLTISHIKKTATVVKEQRDGMETRLKSYSIDLYDGILGNRKGMNIQDY
ncbi:MAG: hypothetical protein WA364_24905 [Candidatus Nitrosopolaris sp.]|jgi:hypothetical protein